METEINKIDTNHNITPVERESFIDVRNESNVYWPLQRENPQLSSTPVQ